METLHIPILIISSSDAPLPELIGELRVVGKSTLTQVISEHGVVDPCTEIAVVDMRGGEKRDVIICALLLRNAGRTVIVCDPRELPLDLLRDLYNFTVREKAAGRKVKTEVLLTEEAMNFLGDVSDIVAEFEKEFLGSSNSLA